MTTPGSLIAVDWGTSTLRVARLSPDGTPLEERGFPRGILTVPPGEFPKVLDQACGDWLREPQALCLISGMAGSRQGWQEAPYVPCPAGFAALAAGIHWITPHRIGIVPGMSHEHGGLPDVMRGEEVQVFGALALLGHSEGTFVLPGTHSKWVQVAGGAINSFATFMSGEVYALLRQHSILSRTLPSEDTTLDEQAFTRGVHDAAEAGSLLRSAFRVRTLALFERMPASAQASYLSGLVIGEELRAQPSPSEAVVLVGSKALTQRYALALQARGVASRTLGAEATWQGLAAIARALQGEQP
jgi:2-dehydro-3-deoxygalactonokinase